MKTTYFYTIVDLGFNKFISKIYKTKNFFFYKTTKFIGVIDAPRDYGLEKVDNYKNFIPTSHTWDSLDNILRYCVYTDKKQCEYVSEKYVALMNELQEKMKR